ncbi:MAG: DUF2298 domain-containing protein [Anaerolineae bacterium]
MLTSIIAWYLTLQFMALIGWPLAFAILRRLPSRGYAVAKALGLLLTGVVFWWGSILHLWENTAGAVLTASSLVLAAGLWLMRRRWGEVPPWLRSHWQHVLVAEALFLVGLVAWSLVRATQPQIQTAGGEKWMEIAFLNALLRTPTMPPHDPWLSGFAISYYYLGYLLLGVLTRLSLLPSTLAFNLGNAGWFALVAVQAYGLLYDMLGGRGVLRGLLAPLLTLIVGNGEGLFEVLHARGLLPASFWQWLDIRSLNTPPEPPYTWIPQRFNWWWQASRTLHDRTPWGESQEVIDEFPAFSFILGDMHPHVLALPFVFLAIALALNAYLHAQREPEPVASEEGSWLRSLWRSLRPRLGPLGGYAVLLGSLGFLNTWDLPIYWALLVGAWVLGRYTHRERSMAAFFDTFWRVLPEAAVLGFLSIGLYVPFWIALRSQAGGILPNLFNATKTQQFVVMFLPLLVPVAGLIVGAAGHRRVRWYRALGLGLALMLAVALLGLLVGSIVAYPYLMVILRGESVQGYTLLPETAIAAVGRRLAHPWVGIILAVGVGTVLLTLIAARTSERGAETDATEEETERILPGWDDRFPLLLALLGLLLTLAPEFVYLQDVFMTRMNTIFKFYFQAWILWGLAGAWQLARWLEPGPSGQPGRPWRRVVLAISAILVAAGLVYTVLAVPARARQFGAPWTLDGADWLAATHSPDYMAIQWLNHHVEDAPVIVEAPGDQHRAYVYEGRVSAFTGLPTVLGWGGHQRQWRGNYDEPARRESDLQLLFTTTDETVTRTILQHYQVAYVYVGPTEQERYPAVGLEKFAEMYPAVYDRDGVVIYRVDAEVGD